VKERPILFSGPMVRALLAGTKTQTRRSVKLDRWMVTAGMSLAGATRDPGMGDGEYLKVPNIADGTRHRLYCPFGTPGERLWVRETHALVPRTAFHHASSTIAHRDSPDGHNWAIYAEGWTRCVTWPWKPSIHMPRWASRIALEISEVRVERVQAISEDDARAEGVDLSRLNLDVAMQFDRPLRYLYRRLWQSINGDDSWDKNPWVWVLSFKRVPA
jgi:hypothetical protein